MKKLDLTRLIRSLCVCLPLVPPAFGLAQETAKKPSAGQVETALFEPIDASRNRAVPVKIYRAASAAPCPVVLFSHGLGGSREGNPYLGNHWAEHGYLAVFLQHPGSDESVWKNEKLGQRLTSLKEAAGGREMLDRFGDVSFLIDQLEKWNAEKDHPLHGALDLEHIGLAGHSFGAVTTMGLAGRRFPLGRDYCDERIDAFLPMSPQPGKARDPSGTFGHITAPILCMTGTEDASPIDPVLTPEDRRKVYAALPPGDKYQLVLDGARHSAFGEDRGRLLARSRNPNHHPAILAISTKFWDAYLKGDQAARKWLQSEAPREACPLNAKDVWEWK